MTSKPIKPWWKKWWAIAIGAFVVLVAVSAIAGGGAKKKSDSSVESAPTKTEATPETDPVATSESVSETTETPATTFASVTTAPPTTLPGFSGGIVLVGADVAPGIYQSTVPPGDFFSCYWERLSDLSGNFEAILANDNVSPGAQAIVEITATDEAFSSDNCGEWSLFAPPPQPGNAFGEGTWIVGQQFVAGRYRSAGDADSLGCYWERLSGVRGDHTQILANDNVEGSAIVDIDASDFAFSSIGCGDWSLVE